MNTPKISTMMKKTILFSAVFFITVFAIAQNDLFFSEYCEGSGNNKGVEIYNPTGQAINLNEYWVLRYGNGSSTFTGGGSTQLVGTIEPYSTFVLVNGQTESTGTSPACSPEMQALANQLDGEYPAPMYMNGNDAIALVKTPNGEPPTPTNITAVDLIGQIGLESLISAETGWSYVQDSTLTYNNASGFPVQGKVINYIVQKYATNGSDFGPFWMSWTSNHTLIRKPEVIQGIVSNPDPFIVKQQWDTIPAQLDSTGQYSYADIWDNLGIHECVVNLTADFSASDTLICEGGIVNFSIEETAYIIESVSWEFPGGNPSTSNEMEPAIEYEFAGDYDVTLVVFVNTGSTTIAKQNFIHVNTIPAIPDKPLGDTLVCFNEVFSDYTTNTMSAIWDLSPSSAGTMNYYDSTCHIIWNENFAGEALLKVLASNICGNSDFSETLTINQTDPSLISFAEDILVCYGHSKLLEPLVSGGAPPFIYSWEPAGLFDDPSSVAPVITPIQTSNINLTITDDYGCTKTETFLVTVEGEDYNIAFTAFPLQFSAPPFNVQFDNQTPNQDNFDYIWYFGNGDSSLLAQPNYTYSGNGLYSVSLIAISKQTGCSDTLVNEDLITCTGASGIGDYDAMNFSYWVNQEEKILGLSFKSQPQNLLFQLFDLYGKEHFSSSIHQKEYSVALQELAPGMYFFVIDSKITGKILIL